LKLSILDQAPIAQGQTASDALQTSIALAQLGDRLGYERYWIAEHHDLFGLACPNPGMMLSLIGSKTERIRIGAGAVLLPYYKPFHVAETYNLLATLYPNRVDIGLGRAPGGSAEVSLALADNYLEQVGHFPEKVKQLNQFLSGTTPEDSLYKNISPTPVPETSPETWILGTSEKSAHLAADLNMPYAFGHFMSSEDGSTIVQSYREKFTAKNGRKPYVIGAIEVVCADTTEEAEQIAMSSILWKIYQEKQANELTVPSLSEVEQYDFSEDERKKVAQIKKKMIIGNPTEVKEEITTLQQKYAADEWMVITITHDQVTKFRSYELLSQMWS